jgi:hypothetical protein
MTIYGTDGRVGWFGSKNPVKKFCRMQWFKDYLQNSIKSPKDSIFRARGKEIIKVFPKTWKSNCSSSRDFGGPNQLSIARATNSCLFS